MSVILTTPYPAINVSSVLPNPKFQNASASEQSVLLHRSTDGDGYTYVKSSERRRLSLPFELSRMKALEVEEVLRVYRGATFRIHLWDDTVWIGQLTNNPLDMIAAARAGGWPGGELVKVTLEFSAYPEAQLIE